MKNVLTVSFVLAATTAMFAAAEIGKPGPDFTATDINGKTHRLADYSGKVVVLEASNLACPFVRNHYKTRAMQELQAELTAKGVVWFVVNSTNPKHPSHRTAEKAKQEWAAQKMKATTWLDDGSGTVGRAYGMKTTPHLSSPKTARSPTKVRLMIARKPRATRARRATTSGKQ